MTDKPVWPYTISAEERWPWMMIEPERPGAYGQRMALPISPEQFAEYQAALGVVMRLQWKVERIWSAPAREAREELQGWLDE